MVARRPLSALTTARFTAIEEAKDLPQTSI